MKSIGKYLSVLLFASCMCAAWPSRVKQVNLPKTNVQMLGAYAAQVKDAVVASPYAAASIVAGVLAGSYFCYKYFFGGSAIVKQSIKHEEVAPIAKHDAKPVIEQQEAVKPFVMQEATPIIEQDFKPITMQEIKPSAEQDVVLQERLAEPTEKVVKAKSVTPVALPIVKAPRTKPFIRVTNAQDQSLNICVSTDGDDRAQQFSVPRYTYGEIRRK